MDNNLQELKQLAEYVESSRRLALTANFEALYIRRLWEDFEYYTKKMLEYSFSVSRRIN